MSGGGSSPLSSLTDLILVSNAGNSSFVVSTDSAPSLFIDSNARVGVNTLTPASQLEVDSATGACLTVRHNASESAYGSLSVSETGDVALNTNGAKVSTNKSLDVENHNGSTVGLALAGTIVQATADELNYVAGATAGSVVSGKAIIANESKMLSGFTALSAEELTGTLQTAAQPNITSVGTLTSLSVAGTFSATQLGGTLQTAAQPNITSVGTLSSLTVTNGVSADTLAGTLQTAAQPNITSVGNLPSVSIAESLIGAEAAFVSGATAGTATAGKVLVLNSGKSITGITSLSATQLSGTLSTAAQPNITSVGNLASVSIAGFTIGAEAAFLSSAVAGAAANSKALVLNSSGSISGIASLSATSLGGTLQTGAQPNITSVGTLGTLTVSGSTTLSSSTDAVNTSTGALKVAGGMSVVKNLFVGGTIDAAGFTINGAPISSGSGSGSTTLPAYLDSITAGTAVASKALVLDSSKNISGIGAMSVGSLTVNGVAITGSGGSGGGSTPLPSYITDITAGTAAANKALVLDSSKSVSGVGALSVNRLTVNGVPMKEKSWTYFTTNNTFLFTVPANVTLIGVYAGGKGGDGISSKTTTLAKGGGGGGFAFGDIPVEPDTVVTITISATSTTLSYGNITILTANAGSDGASGGSGGTATKDDSAAYIITYVGGNGGSTSGGGGGSCGSPLGNGYNGGNTGGGGGGIGGYGGNSGGGGGGAGGSFIAVSLNSNCVGGIGRSVYEKFTDPLLVDAIAPGGAGAASSLNGNSVYQHSICGGGGGGTYNNNTTGRYGGDFGGGGGHNYSINVIGGNGGLMAGGGGAYSTGSGDPIVYGGNGGLGGGGSGVCPVNATNNNGVPGVGGNGFVFIYC